jgi:gamma-D-glutamyl-L-lysine dipeptidyl-peptidase
MQNSICLLSVVPIRKEPAHRSEMVSQLTFGEYVEVSKEEDGFSYISCDYDGYEGWVQSTQLTPVTRKQKTSIFVRTWSEEITVNDRKIRIPMGSPVYDEPVSDKFTVSYNKQGNSWNTNGKLLNESGMLEIAESYLETPYLWGGRSVFGIDCSGFAQQVFKFFGIKLLRDACLQAEQGEEVNSLAEAKACDLAFFKNEKGRITHVGILLSNNRIIHASSKVRIDTIDENGIWNADLNKRTHDLASIRRFVV